MNYRDSSIVIYFNPKQFYLLMTSLKSNLNSALQSMHLLNQKNSNYSNIESPLSPISSIRRTMSFDGNAIVEAKFSKKITIEQFISNVKFILHYYHKDSKIGYEMVTLNFLKQDWEKYMVKLNQRLSFIRYMEPTLKYKTYSEIQCQIIKQWKKNHLLYSLQILWINCLLKSHFQNHKQFQSQIQIQKNFISQINFNVFRPYFSILEEKQFPIIDRLTQEASPFIITSFSDWKKVIDQIIFQLHSKRYSTQEINFEFDIISLQLQEHVIDTNKLMNYEETIKCVQKMVKEVKIMEKIKLLKTIRSTLEDQLKKHQSQLIEQGKLNNYKTIEKDDFIGIIIYCLVKGKIKGLSAALHYFQIMLGINHSAILSRWSADSYRTDLQAGLEYLLSIKNTFIKQLKEQE